MTTTSRYFTIPELQTLRNAVAAERDLAREAALIYLDPYGEWVGTEKEHEASENKIERLTRLMAKLKAPCMF